MDCIIAISGKDFVVAAADAMAARSIVVMKSDHEKMVQMSPHLLQVCNGPSGDVVQFSEFIQKNIKLYQMRNGFALSPHAAAHYTRDQLARALRSSGAYQVNLLLAGYDTINKQAELYFMDYLAALVKVPFGAHGYASHFVLSLLDRYYTPEVTLDEALRLMKMCIAEVQKRLVINLPKFTVRVVDAQGTRDVTLDDVQE
ncbi:proteasome beta 2 subunit [Capsaspora owczarzaki ATCC 30864]|uniref:Proteasome subunit beta n=1 Tax=Capsaspora owczarzaki (strain ATCC 30864) TaxID=595528 RepID=A0A0D2X0E4_CAPO3|nr:proteasome beta 2 subunit [Capsaspora owczarzaki ATCC 30864]KJE88914.1 proteasome beta 2 subunit [Capsaspora owczarzaki ATCC 30864]|eukprot:XP_004365358.1 proteasome beta 2 subunit [Capsaspora owczarzaki ATCC 30864]